MTTNPSQAPKTALEVARFIRSFGGWPIDFEYGVKGPEGQEAVGWPSRRIDGDEIARIWGNGHKRNIGLMNGPKVGDIGDCDFDVLASRIAAAFFLPDCGLRWGRDSNPDSHWEYRLLNIPEGAKTTSYTDPTYVKNDDTDAHKGMLCELNLNKQAMAPGSTHPCGELVRFEPDAANPPTAVEYTVVERGMRKCGSVALLSKFWVEGKRHVMALPLAGMLARGGMGEDEAIQFVRVLCIVSGDDQENNRVQAVHDTYTKLAMSQPFNGIPSLEKFIPESVVAVLRTWLHLQRGAYSGQTGPDGWPLSGIGNAERFVEAFGDKVRWNGTAGEWVTYDSRLWSIDEVLLARKYAMDLARAFVIRVNDDDSWRNHNLGNAPRQACDKHASQLQTWKTINEMLELAKPLLAISSSDFDTDPYLWNLPNGTLELHVDDGTVFLREHRASDYITHMTYGHYVEGATDGKLYAYISRFVPEVDRWAFVEEAMGACMVGTPKRNSMNLIGPSHTGKSMLLRLVRKTWGSYAGELDQASMKVDPHGGDRPRSDLLDLRGLRVVIMPEVGDGALFDGALYKSMFSGGDPKKYRGQDERHGKPMAFTHMLWTSGNEAYGVKANDDAGYERINFIKFEHAMPIESRDDRAEEATINSVETCTALITMAVEGFRRLYHDHHGELMPTDHVKSETARVRKEMDPYTMILEPDKESDAIAEITGDDKDAVPCGELWTHARSERTDQLPRHHMANPAREKLAFEATMERYGAKRMRSDKRFGNRECWVGVRWSEVLARSGTVTLPDWKTGSETSSEGE